MADNRPFTTFNFSVEITRNDNPKPLADAAFSECDGLEMTMESKTIREGGNNGRQIRLSGPMAFGQLTLKRGLTKGFDLWLWLHDTQLKPAHDVRFLLFRGDHNHGDVTFGAEFGDELVAVHVRHHDVQQD